MIKPTVGRVVYYYPKGVADGPPLAAIISCVWSDTCVNLAILNASGTPMTDPPTSILLVQEGGLRPPGGHFCEWMPYQIGQAKKNETPLAPLAPLSSATIGNNLVATPEQPGTNATASLVATPAEPVEESKPVAEQEATTEI